MYNLLKDHPDAAIVAACEEDAEPAPLSGIKV